MTPDLPEGVSYGVQVLEPWGWRTRYGWFPEGEGGLERAEENLGVLLALGHEPAKARVARATAKVEPV